METFTVHPTKINVRQELPRFRQEMGDVESLLKSINKYGQLQPVVVTREMELIAGGRRLAACLLGNREVFCAYHDTVDSLIMREIELEENIQRKSLTPAEEVTAVADLHHIKQSLYGESVSGRMGGWTLDKTAEVLDRTRGSIIDDLHLADAIKMFPELAECKTKSDIRKAVKAIEKISQRSDSVLEYERIVKQQANPPFIRQQDAFSFMKCLEDKSVDLLLTDPPYGINIDETLIGLGRTTGGLSSAGFKFDDSTERALALYKILAAESFRFCKDDGHAYFFVGPEFWHVVRQMFMDAGWQVTMKPIIWIKNESGQCQAPTYWPASCYEMLLYARKDSSRLVLEGRPDWIQVPPVPPSARIHPTEKPVTLAKELISRCVLPGAVIVDPFMGSGALLAGGVEMKCFVKGCDELGEAYSATMMRMSQIVLAQNTN